MTLYFISLSNTTDFYLPLSHVTFLTALMITPRLPFESFFFSYYYTKGVDILTESLPGPPPPSKYSFLTVIPRGHHSPLSLIRGTQEPAPSAPPFAAFFPIYLPYLVLNISIATAITRTLGPWGLFPSTLKQNFTHRDGDGSNSPPFQKGTLNPPYVHNPFI